jgi:hypothetical protein
MFVDIDHKFYDIHEHHDSLLAINNQHPKLFL